MIIWGLPVWVLALRITDCPPSLFLGPQVLRVFPSFRGLAVGDAYSNIARRRSFAHENVCVHVLNSCIFESPCVRGRRARAG